MQLLPFPLWLTLSRAVCTSITVKIPWTKLKSHPIRVVCFRVWSVKLTAQTVESIEIQLDVDFEKPRAAP